MSEPNILAMLWRSSADGWRELYRAQRRQALMSGVPGLLCGIGVFTIDAPWWLNVIAGATVAGSAGSVLVAVSSWQGDQRDREIDNKLAELMNEENGP